MNLSLKFRDRLYQIGQWFVQELDQLVFSIRTTWDVEHNDDGTHGDIHATSLTVRKGTPQEIAQGIKSGNIDTDGLVNAAGTGTFGGNVVAQSVAPTTFKTTIGLVGNSTTLNDSWLGAGTDAASVWAWGMASSGGADRRFAISDLAGNMTPVLVRRDAGGNYYVQPGPVSKGAGMLAYIGNPNDSFRGGWWDGVYGNAFYRNFATVAEGDWQAYTPVFTGLTIGNAGTSFRWTKIGNSILVEIIIIWGTTTTFTAASTTFTLPNNNSGFAAAQPLGSIGMLDASAGAVYGGNVKVNSASTGVLYGDGVPNVLLAAASPFVWTTSDQLTLNLCYQGS